ncbi:DNA polymerase III beta subunit-like protein [Pseudonocardia hierapolitana]|uniref:DNA polymerase III beta subunit-like protein n=1 Tax=Pseudonocardia hierapolitana TaxID=1128676 RepID=A0A561SRB2_9PSEU|nr:MerR family transcriptional regulator [Pseudonocardia hierapolitana]TWF77399.1 DNA polymerase III beta subunit-like protein [Pseudonocardia hierapolitana]
MESSNGAVRTIGRMARESGLSVSALRFYDGAGVLIPATVDPDSGYRYYTPDQVVLARLVASLRRVGMPLAGIREVLAHRNDPAAVDELLDRHLRRLEQGLADARTELSSVRSLIAQEELVLSTTVTVRGADLAAALRAVRFAVGSDPELPVLSGVLLDVTPDALTLVATDRYRLAAAPAPVVALDGPPVAAVLPAALVDRIPPAETVSITVTGDALRVEAGEEVLEGEVIPERFPDYRRLLPTDDRPVPVDRSALRAAVAAAPTRRMRREPDGAEYEVTVLGNGPDGIRVTDGPGVAVNREFLLEALDAGGDGQLLLTLDGPITPLAITAESPRSVSLLMPVRL